MSATHNSTEIKDKFFFNHNRSVKQLIHNTHSDEESKRFTELKTLLNFSSSFLFCTFFNSCSSCHLIISIPKEAKSYRQMFLFFSIPYSQFMSSQTVFLFFRYYFCCLSSLLHYFVIEPIETNASRNKKRKNIQYTD